MHTAVSRRDEVPAAEIARAFPESKEVASATYLPRYIHIMLTMACASSCVHGTYANDILS
jgi:hypothetical protein